jgi:hypothetical protein
MLFPMKTRLVLRTSRDEGRHEESSLLGTIVGGVRIPSGLIYDRADFQANVISTWGD